MVWEAKPGGDVLEYEYDFAGNKTSLTKTVQTDSGLVITTETYAYDDLNRLSSVTDNDGNITSYTYDAVGNRKSMRYPNGNLTDYTYDSLNRLTELTISNGATTIFEQYRYTLHPTGRRTRIEELNGRVTSYQYDKLYRLTQETVTDPVNGNYSALYSYDAVGNRMQSIIDGVTTSYSYDLNDRLLSAGGTTYTYDNNGNTLTKTENGQTTTYGYDPRDRLVSVTDGQSAVTYEYNVDGIRTGKIENGITTRFVVNQNRDYAQVVTEITNGAVEVQYLYGDDLIHQDRAGNLSYYLYDGLGSTRALSDGAGSLTDSYHYDAFGVELARTGNTPNDYLFTGEQFDSSLNQLYLRNRYYNQDVGRFTKMDTFQGVMHDPVTLHKYLYANVDPVNKIDPSGHFGISGAIHAVSAIGSLATAATVGFEAGSILQRSVVAGDILSAANAKSVGVIALSIVPLKYLQKIGDLSAIAAKLERLGFASVIVDKNVKGFNAVFHWVQRMHERGFQVEDVIKAVTQGAIWIDTKSGAILRVLGDPRVNGTIKVVFVEGKITTVLSSKLGGKFVPL